jgi:hypothetical protein
MDTLDLTPQVHTPFADLDLLLSEVDQDAPTLPSFTTGDMNEPETVDAFNAQILAGLVAPSF